MARSQSSTALKIFGASAAAIVGGVAIGYLFGGARLPHPAVQPAPPAVSTTTLPAAPPPSPSRIHPRTANGNYTAPGAPRIVIQEERQPILRRVTPPVPTPDPEATQEAAPVPRKTRGDTPSADTSSANDAGTPPAAAPDSGSSPSTSPAAPATPAAPSAPADQDFERVNGGPKTPPAPGSTTDPEASQQGGTPKQSGDSGRTQFRVQTGAYTDESSARSVADTLRSQGFSTSTHSERDGDHLVYKVQVGAYRSKNGANKAADDLQKKGYPAYISPISP